jgi:hypothetical protein
MRRLTNGTLALFVFRLVVISESRGQIKKNLCSKFYTSIMRALKECYAIFFSQKTTISSRRRNYC